MKTTKTINIYDTTLHDSHEWPSQRLSTSDRRTLVQMLDSLGVDYVEIGLLSPRSGTPAAEREILDLPLKHTRLVAAASLPGDPDSLAQWDLTEPLRGTGTPAINLVLRSPDRVDWEDPNGWDRYFDAVGGIIRDLKIHNKEVFLEVGDFFEGYRQSSELVQRLLRLAEAGGADRFVLNETTGRTLPWEAGTIVHELCRNFPRIKFGVHFHDMGHSAVAGALTAVDQGAALVQGSINGFGSRSGQANLCNIIPDLELIMGYRCLSPGRLPGLLDIAQYLMGVWVDPTERKMRYIGRSEQKVYP